MALIQQIDRVTTIKATEDLVGKRFVGYDGKKCGAGKKALGVALFDIDNGGMASVAVDGRVIVEAHADAGETISPGDAVKSNANGMAILWDSTSDDATAINGYARTSLAGGTEGADGEIEIELA